MMSNVPYNLSSDHPSRPRFNDNGDRDASYIQWKAGRDPGNGRSSHESMMIPRIYTSNCSRKGRNAEQPLDYSVFRGNPCHNSSWAPLKTRQDQRHNSSVDLRSEHDDAGDRSCSAPCNLYNVDNRGARMHSVRSWRPPYSLLESQGPGSSRWQGLPYSSPDALEHASSHAHSCRQRAEFCIPSCSTSSYVLPAGARNPGTVPLARPYGRPPQWSRCRKAIPSNANLKRTPPPDHLVELCDDQRIGLRLGDDGGCTFPHDIYMGRKSLSRQP